MGRCIIARPQLEDGHTRIANELLEHLVQKHLSPNQWQVLLCIMRKTYGYHKKVDYIANSQIVEATKLCKAVVSRALRKLQEAKIIERNGKSIGLQKDWEKWQELAEQSILNTELAEQLTPEKLAISTSELAISTSELAESSTKVSSCAVTQKIKDTKQKILNKRYIPSFDIFYKNYPKKKAKDDAKRAFAKINPSEELLAEMLVAIEKFKKTDDWIKEGGKYIPYPATWLRGKRWEDEIEEGYGKSRRRPRGLPKNYTPSPDYSDTE